MLNISKKSNDYADYILNQYSKVKTKPDSLKSKSDFLSKKIRAQLVH